MTLRAKGKLSKNRYKRAKGFYVRCIRTRNLSEIAMYLNIPFLDTAISHKKHSSALLDTVDRCLEHLDIIASQEEKLTELVHHYAHEFQLSCGTVEQNTTFRRCLRLIINTYRLERKKLDSFAVPESSLDAPAHEEYLRSLVAAEVLGHLILSQNRIKFGTRACDECDTFFIDTQYAPTSLWGCRGIRRINLPDGDGELTFKFGKYNAEKRDFE